MLNIRTKKNINLLLFLAFAAWASIIPNSGMLEFRNEESLRALVSWEMFHNKNFSQTYFLGESYFKKPPAFNWLTIAASQLTGWNELAVRLPSILAFLLTIITTYYFSSIYFNNRKVGALSALLVATTPEILFFYGLIGEIDATFMFATFNAISLLLIGHHKNKSILLFISAVFLCFSFLLKGLPAIIFYGTTLISILITDKNFRLVKNPFLQLGITSFILVTLFWLYSTNNHSNWISVLTNESTNRVTSSFNLAQFTKHIALFPIEGALKLLPASLIIFFVIGGFFNRQNNTKNKSAPRFLLILLGLSALPYVISSGARLRYLLPLVPIAASLSSYYIITRFRKNYLKVVLTLGVSIIFLRLTFGFFGIPKMHAHNLSKSNQLAARTIISYIDNESIIACDCLQRKDICLYAGLATNKVIKSPSSNTDWEFKISCSDESNVSAFRELKDKNSYIQLFIRK